MQLPTIDRRALDAVTGGRITHVDQLDPKAVQGMNNIAQALDGVKQQMAKNASDQQGFQQQAFQKMMEMKQGRGHREA